jgi:hypothetical protein
MKSIHNAMTSKEFKIPVLVEKINTIHSQPPSRSLPLFPDELWIPTNLSSLLIDSELGGDVHLVTVTSFFQPGSRVTIKSSW